jgi:hypothetical protein
MIGMNLINKLLLTVRIDYRIDVFHEFFDCSVRPNLSATLATDQKLPLKKSSPYILTKFSRVPLTIVLIPLTVVNGTVLNFGKRFEDDLRVIFDQWPKLHLGLDVLSNQKILKGIYYRTNKWQE